ncbi:MAG: MFS transporter [Arenicellales bacterium]|jgi:MFS family permease|nr:MFS transporter [Arenicellales bacterium]
MLFSALRSPRYRRYWFGSIGTVGASQLILMAQGWLVFQLSGSPMDLGALGAAVSVPSILIMIFGGILADRWDRRRLIMTTSVITAGLLLIQAALDYLAVVEVWHVLVIGALIGIVTGFEWPTRQAFFASLIEPDQMMSAVSLNSILWQASRMVLPGLTGILIAAAGTSMVFVMGALGFMVMFATLLGMPVRRQAPVSGNSVQQFLDGMRFIVVNRVFLVLIPMTWVWMFFGFSFNQLMPAFADVLGTRELGFGALMSAVGAGSAAGTILVGPMQKARLLGGIMFSGLLGGVAGLTGFGVSILFGDSVSWSFNSALVAAFVVGLFGSVFLITSMTVLQIRVPDVLRGRVMGIHTVSFYLMPLGGLFGGVLASAYSPGAAVLTGTGVILAVTLAVVLTQREIRQIDGRRLTAELRTGEKPVAGVEPS